MTEWYGWAGTILEVNLTTGEIVKTPLDRELAAKHIGGAGLAVKILYDEVEPGTDPLGPDNILMVTQGPLSGTTAPSSGRYDIITKGPQTGIYLRSNGGGFFGPELKWAGYDLIIFRGASKKPVYLWIDDDQVELRDAAHLWGKDTWVTQDMIRKELGDEEIQTLKVGPSGENMGFSACVIGDLGRAAGKAGGGAVWGSKKLKAVAVRGTKGVNIARPDEFLRLSLEKTRGIESDPMYAVASRYGTPGFVSDPIVKSGFVPGFDPNGLSSEEMWKRGLWDKSLACFGCPVHCDHYYSVKEGKYKGTTGAGLEGNGVVYGSYLFKIDNPAFDLKANTLCNQLGLHVNNPGCAINWAMQLWEDGIITREDTGGLELTWGNEEVVLELMHQMARREGFGALLDEYPVRAAERLGRGSEKYISHNKGMTARGFGISGGVEVTLAFATSTRGHDHLVGKPPFASRISGINLMQSIGARIFPDMADPKELLDALAKFGQERYGDKQLVLENWWATPQKARLVYDSEHICALCDSTGICKIPSQFTFFASGYHLEDFASLLSAATGVDFTPEDTEKAAERQMLIERCFNAREEIRRRDDYPWAFRWQREHGEPHPRRKDIKFPITLEDYDRVLDEYYRLHGCDPETGIPTRERLEEFGLGDVARDLIERGVISAEKVAER
ncbi:MAG: aldehyde ferredoxin oxidoreductase C-terminal domain-containing protein [Chloroflexota bacterium]